MRKTMRIRNLMTAILVAFGGVLAVSADVIDTKEGAHLVGKITQIDGSVVAIDTKEAGLVKVKQSDVVAITSDHPVNVRLSSGTVIVGTISSPSTSVASVTGSEGSINSSVDKIVAIWNPGDKDPEVVAMQRSWAYEATVDILGKTGNSEQLGTGFSFRATLVGPQDKLQFYTAYDREVTEGTVSTDQFKAGTDYQNSFSGRHSWYLRDEAGFDRVKLIEFSNVAAAGFGYDFVKQPKETLTGRLGFAHRFESYRDDPVIYAEELAAGASEDNARRIATKPSFNSAGLDMGLSHSLVLANFSVTNRLNIVPAFKDFSDFRATHESYLELPLHIPFWKLRVGISNDYTSKPSPGKRRLDTIYYTHLVLNWK